MWCAPSRDGRKSFMLRALRLGLAQWLAQWPAQWLALWFALWLALLASVAQAQLTEVRLPDGRSYQIALPDGVLRPQVIIGLHGGGGNPLQFALNSGLMRPALANGHAVIFAAGTSRAGPLLAWNAGYCCGPAAARGVDDIGFLDRVIDDAAARFGTDRDGVFITGMSNGAMMAEAYAAARPGRVRAVAGVAGTLDLARFAPRGAVPLLHIHGTADTAVPYAGGFSQSGVTRTDFTPVAAVIAAFVAAAPGPLRMQATQVDGPLPVTRHDWLRPDGRAMVRLITIEGGTHVWPGGRRARRSGQGDGVNATQEILAFFALYR